MTQSPPWRESRERAEGSAQVRVTDNASPSHSSYAVEGQGDLLSWIARNREEVDTRLAAAGVVLFRGFDVSSAAEFAPVAESICGELFSDNGEHMPVPAGSGVQTPVFYPPEKQLLWHNENSFNSDWPLRIVFCCGKPAEIGGETPLVDSRRVFDALDPAIRREFSQRQVMYARSYQPGVGLPWQKVFGTSDRSDVQRQCREQGLRYEWFDGGRRLRTTCVRPGVIPHPGSGRMSWFNQAQHWHTACLDEQTREALLSMFSVDELPRSCFYGDGSVIDDSVMAEILDVYRSLEFSFSWQVGDVLAVDNVAVAHGRNPYRGDRKLFVAMGGRGTYADARVSP